MAAQLNPGEGEVDSEAETVKSGGSIDIGISGDAPNGAEIIGDVRCSGLGPPKVAKLEPEEVDSDAETVPSGGGETDSDAETVPLESMDDERFSADTLRDAKVPGDEGRAGRGAAKCAWLNPEEEENFWGYRSGKIVPWGWTASRREARLAEMSRPVVPRSSARRLEELIKTFHLNRGGDNYSLWVKEEDEVRRSSESGRKRQVSPEKRGRMPPHMVESKDEKEPLKDGQVECVKAWIRIKK